MTALAAAFNVGRPEIKQQNSAQRIQQWRRKSLYGPGRFAQIIVMKQSPIPYPLQS